jgi:hypothetical protein
MEKSRYIMPTPAGMLSRLGVPQMSDERRLFEHVLLCGRPQPVDMAAFGVALGLSVASIARLMFALNRTQSISVLEEPPSARVAWAESGLAGLGDNLAALAIPGQKLLLSSADGLCIARVGWTAYEADVMATREPRDYQPSMGEIFPLHVGTRCFYLSANARIDQKNTVLLNLGYRLLQGCSSPPAKEQR